MFKTQAIMFFLTIPGCLVSFGSFLFLMMAGAAIIWGPSSAGTSRRTYMAVSWHWLWLGSHLGLLIVALHSHSQGYSVWLGHQLARGLSFEGWCPRARVSRRQKYNLSVLWRPALRCLRWHLCCIPLVSTLKGPSARVRAAFDARSSMCSWGREEWWGHIRGD